MQHIGTGEDAMGQVRRLERWLKLATGSWAVAAAVLVLASWASPRVQNQEEILRARALILLDSEGKERVVLGAPIPDLEAGLRESPAVGMAILAENGADRVVVGAPVPDPRIKGQLAKRIAPANGIQVNDENGNERGGFGYLDNDRVVLGLDHERGEGAVLFVLPEGRAGLMISPQGGRAGIFLGIDSTSGSSLLVMRDSTGTKRARLSVRPDQSTGLELLDPEGAPLFQVPRPK
jgi:hypothetical protein